MTYPPTRWPAPLLRLIAKLWNDGVNTARPVTQITVPDIAAPNVDIALSPKGTGAISAHVPDGTAAGGNKRGANAVDWQTVRTTGSQVASSFYSIICGGQANTASGGYSTVVGGDSNTASGSNSFVGGGSLNTASGNYSIVVGGGSSNTASGSYSIVGGGNSNLANSDYSAIIGGAYGTTRSIVGYHAFPACNSPITTTRGVSQAGLLILGRQTTDATATALASNTTAAGTGNQLMLTTNSAFAFSGEVIAAVNGGGDTARWTLAGAIKKGGSNGSTALVGTPTVTMTHNDAGAAGWIVALTADTINGALRVTVTGAAATTIRWVCRLDTTEVAF